MKTLSIACGLLVVTWILPTSIFAQNSGSASQAESGQRRTVGAPQVLEIPVPQADAQTDVYQEPYQDSYQDPYQDNAGYAPPAQAGQNPGYDSYDDTLQQAAIPSEQTQAYATGGQRTYLGVLYATAEQGPPGVKVLSLVPDSPAHRAGFIGANAPEEEGSDLLRAAIVVLAIAMSPAGPFAIPLAIAHDMYTSRDAPGDLIVSINNTPTPDAQEFTAVMRQYQPGDTVSFSIVRAGEPMQISVTLEEEPL